MKRLIIIIIFTLLINNLYSQDYLEAGGMRGGITSGFTYKKFLDPMKAMEAILSFKHGGMQITALRQYHTITLFEFSDNFYFINGYGIHAGFYFDEPSSFLKYTRFEDKERVFAPLVGIDAYLGLEYRFDRSPLVIGLDYKPFLEFSLLPFSMNIWDTAFYIKYIFSSR